MRRHLNVGHMNRIEEDELRPEYDVKNLQVRKFGAERGKFCDTVRLEPDVVATFSNAEAVNKALRYLIEVSRRSTNPTRNAMVL